MFAFSHLFGYVIVGIYVCVLFRFHVRHYFMPAIHARAAIKCAAAAVALRPCHLQRATCSVLLPVAPSTSTSSNQVAGNCLRSWHV